MAAVDAKQRHHHHDHVADKGTSAKDPVCGMTVEPATAKQSQVYEGTIYVFCSAGCADKFRGDPPAI